jgi:hypothetical protein
MPRAYSFKPVHKTCRACGVDFIGHSNKQYCNTACRDKSDEYQQVRQKLRNSNLDYFLREKIFLATRRGKHPVEVVVDELKSLWDKQGGLCALSGVPMTYEKGKGRLPTNLSIDRKDSGLGYTLDNVQLVCYQANLMKSELTTAQLKFWCERILYATQLPR